MSAVPQAHFATIGGSSTFSIHFPEDLSDPNVEVLEEGLLFDTPFGKSPSFKLFELGDAVAGNKQVLACKMHGWRDDVGRADASRQLFWVLREAGVERIVAEGGVGAINPTLPLGSFVVPNDYIDFSLRRDVALGSDYLLMMRRALCPEVRENLIGAASKGTTDQVIDQAVYVVTDGRHFESPAETRMMAGWGADVVGQSLCPEVYLARETGTCYAGIHLVVNRAEGVGEEWQHDELKGLFHSQAILMGKVLLDTLRRLPDERHCDCLSLRKKTLLKEQ